MRDGTSEEQLGNASPSSQLTSMMRCVGRKIEKWQFASCFIAILS